MCRHGMPDPTHEALRAPVTWDEAEPGLGQPDRRAFGEYGEAACQHQLEPASQRQPVDGRDDGNRQAFDPAQDPLSHRQHVECLFRSQLGEFAEVGTRAEGLWSGSCDHDGANRTEVHERGRRGVQPRENLGIEGVV
jgi:hypothetical protein